jgi:signal transduction histidine kinase
MQGFLHNEPHMARTAPPFTQAASRAVRSACLPWLLWCWLSIVLAAPSALAQELGEPARFDDALLVNDADTPHFPADAPTRVVTLPDEWSSTRPREPGPAWYRLRFDAPSARERGVLLGLLVERACGNVEMQLNGQRLFVTDHVDPQAGVDCERPLLVALPAALVEPRGNTIDLRLAGQPLERVASRQRAGALSAPLIGPYATLHAQHERVLLLRTTVPQVASATLLLMGAVVFVMGWWSRPERHLVYFGLLSIGWALVTARLWWHGTDLPTFQRELLLLSLVPLVTLAAVRFLFQYADRRSRPIEVALIAQCLIVPASVALAGPTRVNTIASTWYALLVTQALAAMVFYLWTTWNERASDRRRNFWPMLGLLLTIAAMVGVEFAAQQQLVGSLWRTLPNVLMPLAFLATGLWLVHDYGTALRNAEQLRASLESRIRDATATMEKSYSQMAELRVEQVTQQERKRIAADLHDDLGAKLLTIVHTSESERISTLAREALEEMRLSVRGLTGKPVKLIDALGDWRAEVVGRLSQTGVEGDWQAPNEEVPQTLSARAYVQTTRILREAVNNIIKHSGASRCSIRVTLSAGDFQLKIQDNGKGIPLELDGRLDRGHGMSSMKHRAKQLQGQCLVESGPGYGTVIRLTIPLEKHTLPA